MNRVLKAEKKPPACPECRCDAMQHVFYGIGQLAKNGWYCDSCKAGPYRLDKKQQNT